MAAVHLDAVVPGTCDADFEEDTSAAFPLEDISLIVIGRGSIAEDVVRRRRAAGGRVCWLWTERFPLAAMPGPVADRATSHFEDDDTRGTQSGKSTIAWAERVADFRLDMSNFVWKPPQHEQRSASFLQQDSLFNKTGIGRLRWRFGTSRMPWRATGPDIVRLGLDEDYRLTGSCDGRAPGIQVVKSEDSVVRVIWEMSGKIVFAGQQFQNLPRHPMATIASSAVAASQISMDSLSEEAKPFVTVNIMHVCVWAGVSFVQFVIFFVFMAIYEPTMQPGDIPWWRASFSAFTSVPFGYSAFPKIFSLCLLGRQLQTEWACRFLAFVYLCSQSAPCIIPPGWIDGHWRTWSPYAAQSIALPFNAIVALLVTVFTTRKSKRELITLVKQSPWYPHTLWFIWTALGTFGTWIILYGVALLYGMLESWNKIIATLFLPLVTSLVEMSIRMMAVLVYRRLVYSPRMGVAASAKRSRCMVGDQKQVMLTTMCMTHAYAESTRLVSLLVTVVKKPSWDFIFPLLVCFLYNVFWRCDMFTEIISRIVPRSGWRRLVPDAGTVMMNEVKLCFGYPRFVSLAALALSNVIVHGLSREPFFNTHSAGLVLLAAALEVVEDLVVCCGQFTARSWWYRTASYYRGMHPLSLSQVMSFDSDGVQPRGPAIGFSGMRYLPFRCVVVLITPSCFFAYILMSLLLGAGFVHNVCPSWLRENIRLQDGLMWQTPLQC